MILKWRAAAFLIFQLFRKKCDNNNDCEDESDEKMSSCDYVIIKDTYNKALAPRDPFDNSKPVTVYFSLMINQLREIDTPDLKFTIDYYLT